MKKFLIALILLLPLSTSATTVGWTYNSATNNITPYPNAQTTASTSLLSASTFWVTGQGTGCATFSATGLLTSTGIACGSGSGGSGVATTSLLAAYPISVTKTAASITFSLLDMATTTASCSGTASCTPFTIIGSSPITITGSAGTSASSTLLSDNNTFSGINSFTNVSSNFSGTWQTYSPSHFQVAGTGTSGNCVQWGAGNTLGDAGAPCGTGGGGGIASSTLRYETPAGTNDGVNKVFTVTHSPLALYLNGAFQSAGGVDYTLTGSSNPYTITFVNAPVANSVMESQYGIVFTDFFGTVNTWTALNTFSNATINYASTTETDATTFCLGGTCRTTWPTGTIYTGTWPIVVSGSAISWGGLSTSTSNTWGGTQTFTGTITGSISGNAGTVTNGIYNTDTGTVTNTMLAGSIANAKLLNSSITVNGVGIALGASGTIQAASSTLLGDTNTWTKLQGFSNATSTLFSAGALWDTGLGAGFVQSSATGLFSSAALTSAQITTACPTCLTAAPTITLTGAVTGSGTGSFATTYAGTLGNTLGGTGQDSHLWNGLAAVNAGVWSALSTTSMNASITGSAGSATGNAGSATLTAITDDTATNATMYPTWVTTTSGNQAQKTSSSKLFFNPSTGLLTATGFSGPLTGNVTGNVSGTAATVTGATQANITTLSNLVTTGTITTGTWSGSFGSVSGANLTSLTAANITGSHTLPDGVLSTNVPLLNAANTFTNSGNTSFAGNVGIGTTTPAVLLDMYKGGANAEFGLTTNGDFFPDIYLQRTGGSSKTNYKWSTTMGSAGQYILQDVTAGNLNRMIIDTSGNIGLGVNNATVLNITSGGNVGIGTTGPDTPLEVSVSAPAQGILSHLSNSSGTGGAYTQFTQTGVVDWAIGAKGSNTNFVINTGKNVSTAGTDLVTVTTAGYVGIGTTAPGSALDVTGTIRQSTVKSCTLGVTTDSNGGFTGCVASDETLKTNIATSTWDALSIVNELRPVTYNWIATSTRDSLTHSGFIAQDVQKVDPTAVEAAGQGLLGVDPNAINALLVSGMQEQQQEIATLQAQVAALQKQCVQ